MCRHHQPQAITRMGFAGNQRQDGLSAGGQYPDLGRIDQYPGPPFTETEYPGYLDSLRYVRRRYFIDELPTGLIFDDDFVSQLDIQQVEKDVAPKEAPLVAIHNRVARHARVGRGTKVAHRVFGWVFEAQAAPLAFQPYLGHRGIDFEVVITNGNTNSPGQRRLGGRCG